MSTIEPDERFLAEEELRALLERWQSPEPSDVLGKRITSSYLQEIKHASVLNDSIQLSKTDNEVVAMKFCSTCQEEFADKFSFCPVDGTPLSVVTPVAESSVTASVPTSFTVSKDNGAAAIPVSESAAAFVEAETYTTRAGPVSSKALVPRGEYDLTMMSDRGLAGRLGDELKDVSHEYELTWPEFKRDPMGFMKRSFVGYGQMAKRSFGNRNVMIAMAVAVFGLLALGVVVALLDRTSGGSSRAGVVSFAVVAFCVLVAMFASQLGKDRGAAVMGAQPSDSRTVAIGMVAAFVFIFAVLGGFIWQEHRHQNQLLA